MSLFLTTVVVFACAWMCLPYLIKIVSVWRLRQLCRAKKAIVLTYDDGPSPELTPKLLTILEEFGVRATFFMLGSRLRRSPATAAIVLAQKHELGSHSENHLNAWKSWPWLVTKDIREGIQAVDSLGGNQTLFRPPHGKITIATLTQMLINHKHIAWWTIDSTDTFAETKSPEKLLERLLHEGGGIVLMHDFYRENKASRNQYVLDTTRLLLEMARREGFQVMTMSTLLDA